MVTITILNALKDFIEKYLDESECLMQLENTNEEPVYVVPYVEVCHMPHKNFTPKQFQVPYVLIMLDEDADDEDGNELSLRLVFGAYGGGFYDDENGNPTTVPDAKGYVDLLNLRDKVKQKLLTTTIINEKTVIRKPYKGGMYDTEDTWPFFYGYSIFTATGISEGYLMPDET